jgi:hypothetical protein
MRWATLGHSDDWWIAAQAIDRGHFPDMAIVSFRNRVLILVVEQLCALPERRVFS